MLHQARNPRRNPCGSAHTLRTHNTFSLQDQYKSLGEHVQAVKVERMKSQLATFKSSLEQFAIKHRCATGRRVKAKEGTLLGCMPYCKRQLVCNWRPQCVKQWYSYWSDAAAGRRSGRAQCSERSSTGCAPTSASTRWCPTRACGRSSWALATSTPSWASKLLRPAFPPGKHQIKDDLLKRKGLGLDVRRLVLRIGVQVIETCLAITANGCQNISKYDAQSRSKPRCDGPSAGV